MNKLYRLFTLSLVALLGLSLTGCSEDNLDTNPYNKSGVNIVAFGPSPILRTHEIRITGTNLESVSSVAFPGEGAVVEKAAFNKVDNRDIYVNVPDTYHFRGAYHHYLSKPDNRTECRRRGYRKG